MKRRQRKIWVFLGSMMLVLGATGLAVEHLSEKGLPFLPSVSGIPFLEGKGLDYDQAKATYLQAASALADHRSREAIEAYRQIQDVYPALRPFILYHQAEAHVQLGQEAKAQALLKTMEQAYRGTPFAAIALYALGQSQVRGHQPEEAKASFQGVIAKLPDSNVAVGSYYYLGQLASESGQADEAAKYWRLYLRHAPEGTFGVAAAEGLAGLTLEKAPEDYALIGKARLAAGNAKEAAGLLSKAPFAEAWYSLGKAYLQTGNQEAGLQALRRGLLLPGDADQAQEAVKTILSQFPASPQKIAVLKQLLALKPKAGGDFILWQLARMTVGPTRAAYQSQLLSTYPKSDYAPETSWALAWEKYRQGKGAEFLVLADRHLSAYPNSMSAPRILFWKAKWFLNQGKVEVARPILARLTSEYPNQYYSFRAEQILKNDHFPWTTRPGLSYPPDNQPESLDVRPFVADLNPSVASAIAELVRIGAPDDILTLLQLIESGNKPSPLGSLAYGLKKDYPRSLRLMRDYTLQNWRKGQREIPEALARILYPIVYADEIAKYTQIYNLDPYLVQALMRQESYFNPMAVSSSRAMGLMQLLPSTADYVAQWEKMSGSQVGFLFNPEVNVHLGTRYLKYLHEKFDGNSMLAVGSYNGGPGAMGRWVSGSKTLASDPDMFVETIPYDQSRDYIKEVFSHYWHYRQLYHP